MSVIVHRVSRALIPVQALLCSLYLLMLIWTLSFNGGQSLGQDPFSSSREQLLTVGKEACSQHEEENHFFLMFHLCCLSHIRLKKKTEIIPGRSTTPLLRVLLLSFLCPQDSFLSPFTKTLTSAEEVGTAKSVTVRRPSLRCEMCF